MNNRDRDQAYLFKSVPSTMMTSRADNTIMMTSRAENTTMVTSRGDNTTMMTSRITPLSSKLNWKSNRDD